MTFTHRMSIALAGASVLALSTIVATNAQQKTPTYVVLEVDQITDADAFGKAVGSAPPLPAGAKYIIRTMKPVARDGSEPPVRFVVIQFETPETAAAWSASVKDVDAARLKHTKSRSFLVEGFSG